jgi:hypothetical protein
MSTWEFIGTGAAALLWTAIFLWGGSVHLLSTLITSRRGISSFGTGVSVAYVFVYMMPELHNVRRTFAESVAIPLRYEGMATYFLSLIGFLTFYGAEHLRLRMRGTNTEDRSGSEFWLSIGGFAAYVCLMGYLLINNLQETPMSIALYAAALAFHFLAVDRALRDEHGIAYHRVGRLILAAMPVIGWVAAMLFMLPPHVVALLVAFLSGAIIMNSTILELRTNDKGRLLPMIAGGVIYGLILIPFG